MSSPFLMLAQAGASPGGPMTIVWIAGIFLIMYFVMIRPQQKQLKDQRTMIAALKKGDDVITQGGMLGKVYLVTDKLVTLEVANGVRVRILKTSIQGKAVVNEEVVPATAEKKEEK